MDLSILVSARVLFPLALLALLVPLVVGFRHRILVAMAFRNALRRKRQSAMIVAGLMVGTAIVAGAQVAGDSMGYAIQKATLDAFEEIDETVYLDGYNFFPQNVVDALRADPFLARSTDAIGGNILWDVAVKDQRSRQYEPSAHAVGFDPSDDQRWGPFRSHGSRFDGTDLAPDEVVINTDLAEKLDARIGDTLSFNYSLPQDPLVPRITNYTGTVNASFSPPIPLPGLPPPPDPLPSTFRFHVDPSAVRVNILLTWRPTIAAPQDLDLRLTDPTGRRYTNQNGSLGAPDLPAFLFVNGSVARPLPPGDWTLDVTGKASVQTPFNGTIATFYAVYNLTELERRVGELQRQFPGIDPSDFTPAALHTATFRIAHITEGGKGPNFQLPNKLTLYVRLDALQSLLGRPGEINFVKVSNPGGVEAGARATPTVYPLLWERLNATKKLFPDNLAIQALQANNDKQFWLDQAQRLGELFSVFLTFVGSFSIISGLLLIINIFTMLAEERKAELGIARAVGLRRGHLIQLFTYEGIFYALPAAGIGIFFGLGLAAVLVWGFNTFNPRGTFPAIPFRVENDSLPFAFAVGILLTVATVLLGATRVSRLNVVAAIRNLEPPARLRGATTLVTTAACIAAGTAGTLYAILANSFTWQLFGPLLIALGLALLLRFFLDSRLVYPTAALGLFAYLTVSLFTVTTPQTREADVIGPVRSVVMALCLVVAFVYTEAAARVIGRLLSHVRALRPVALPAVAYPLHKKLRTGLTLSMFSVILLVVLLFSILGSLFEPDVAKESGGYQVEGVSGSSFDDLRGHGADPRVLDDVDVYDVLPYFVRYGGDIVTINNESTGQFGPPANTIVGTTLSFAQHNQYRLLQRDPAYATDKAAYTAVAQGRGLVIVSYPYSTDRDGRDGAHTVGDTLQLKAKGGLRSFRIIGIQEQYHLPGVFINGAEMKELFSTTDTIVLFRLKDPTKDETMAQRLEANYEDLGLDANSVRVIVLRENEGFRQIFTLIRLFLGLGLIVGILSLGIVTSRNVIERRQEIGMMRALGYLRRHIRRTFLVETLSTITLGLLIGLLVALIVSFAIWDAQLRQLRLPYTIPWIELAIISGIAYGVTTLATLSPILRAARTPPAEALRYIE